MAGCANDGASAKGGAADHGRSERDGIDDGASTAAGGSVNDAPTEGSVIAGELTTAVAREVGGTRRTGSLRGVDPIPPRRPPGELGEPGGAEPMLELRGEVTERAGAALVGAAGPARFGVDDGAAAGDVEAGAGGTDSANGGRT